MSDLQGVAESIKILVKPGGFILIEVPNFACNLRCNDYGLWEEHVNYFTLDTLRYLMAQADVEMIHEEIILFSGEGIFVIGRKTGSVISSLNYVSGLRNQNLEYSGNWPGFRQRIEEFLSGQKKNKKKIALYGAGSRAFCLLNFANIASYVDIIVDDQAEKQNKFMPGGRLPIISSDALLSQGINICLLAVNTENEEKVIGKHGRWAQNGGKFWSVLPPSTRLLPIWEKHDK